MNEIDFNNRMLELDASEICDKRGEFDLYVCDRCHEFKATTCIDKGVNPLIIQCDKCKNGVGCMHNVRTFDHADISVVYQEWRRPTYSEFKKMGERMQKQILSGVLILDERKRNIKQYL